MGVADLSVVRFIWVDGAELWVSLLAYTLKLLYLLSEFDLGAVCRGRNGREERMQSGCVDEMQVLGLVSNWLAVYPGT